MDRNIVTLQLTVPALEKLFEGDPEFVLSIKQAAFIEFGRRKIGELLDKSTKADIEAAIANHVGTISTTYHPPQIKLQQPILDMIHTSTQRAMNDQHTAIASLIKEAIDKAISPVTESIDEKIKREVDRRVNNEVAVRVATEVKAKINDILKAAQM